MRAVIVLCDFAEQSAPGDKVHMLGAGWSMIGPQPSPHAVVAMIKVAWTETNRPHEFVLRLTDSDGQVVMAPGPAAQLPLEISGKLEVGRPPGIPEGSELDTNFVAAIQPLQLVPGQRYTWRLVIDGEEATSESFAVRQLTQHQARPTT